MNDRFWAELWLVIVLLVIATGLLAHTGVDQVVASRFYIDGGWPIGKQFPWYQLYKIDRLPGVLLALGGLVLALRGFSSRSCVIGSGRDFFWSSCWRWVPVSWSTASLKSTGDVPGLAT